MTKSPPHRQYLSLAVRGLMLALPTLFASQLHAQITKTPSEEHLPSRETTRPTFVRCAPSSTLWHCNKYDVVTGELIPLSNQDQSALAYDWVKDSELSAQQLKALTPGTKGMYLDPTLAIAARLGTVQSPDMLPLFIEADDSIVNQNEHAQLSGRVQVTQGARLLSAENMSYDLINDVAELNTNVTIRNPGILIRGDHAKVSATKNEAAFEEAMFVLHEPHLRGGAQALKQTSATSVELVGGRFTSCEPGNNSWMFEGESIKINTETAQGEARNVKLKIGPVPVLYLPYLSFPVGDSRQSGFLFPSFSTSDTSGLDIAIPYYWNAGPNYDATFTPRYISKRGAMVEAEGRHLSEEFYTIANFTYLPNDSGGLDPDVKRLIDEGDITEEQAAPYKGQSRWLAHLDQSGGGGNSPWYTSIDYAKVSDVDYFRDIDARSFSVLSSTHLNQSLESSYQFAHWNISALFQDHQMLLYNVDDPYRRAPQINLSGLYRSADFALKLNHEYTQFDHKNTYWGDGSTIVKGSRINTDYRLNWNKRSSWGFFVPEVGLQALAYNFNPDTVTANTELTPTVTTGQASLDMGLIFENPRGKILQTFEPRIYYLYRDYEDHSALFNVTDDNQFVNFDTSERTFTYSQLYRDSRFSGHDRLDDANRATIGVTTRWFSNDSGRELFTLSAGKIFYHEDRRVGLVQDVQTEESSETAAELRFAVGTNTSVYASAVYDEENREFLRSTGGIHYANSQYSQLANISYSYVKDRQLATNTPQAEIDQIDLSFLTPISDQWYAMGRTNYDFTNERELEAFLGLEYNNCCYRVRLLARRWLDSNIATLVDNNAALYDNGIFFELHLKGLGSAGAKISSLLGDSIFGYQEREQLINP